MGTHPIFESDFDCLTDCRSRSSLMKCPVCVVLCSTLWNIKVEFKCRTCGCVYNKGIYNKNDDADDDDLDSPTLNETFFAMCSNEWCNYRELIRNKDFDKFNRHKIQCRE